MTHITRDRFVVKSAQLPFLMVFRFNPIGVTQIKSPRQAVFTLDHDVQNRPPKNLAKYVNIEAFARSHGVEFYRAGRGIGHQVLVGEGYAFPSVIPSRSRRTATATCMEALGASGRQSSERTLRHSGPLAQRGGRVPRMVKVELRRSLTAGVTGKDRHRRVVRRVRQGRGAQCGCRIHGRRHRCTAYR